MRRAVLFILTMINLSGNSISTVWRQDGWIYKKQPKYLCDNEFWCLLEMSATGYVPTPCRRIDEETIMMEDLGDSHLVIDDDNFLYHYYVVLQMLKRCGIRHGDLTEYSLIVKDDKPYLIDFAESRLWDDPRPDKRPEGDAFWLRQTMKKLCAKI